MLRDPAEHRAPRRAGLPAVRVAAGPGDPPPAPPARAGLPVRPLCAGLQCLDGDGIPGDASQPLRAAVDPPQRRARRADGSPGPGARLPARPVDPAPAPDPGEVPRVAGPP